MATTKVYLKHSSIDSGNPVPIACTGVKVLLSKTNDKKPNANYNTDTPARVQSLSLENPRYTLEEVKLNVWAKSCSDCSTDCQSSSMNVLSYDKLLKFYKIPNDESDPIYLCVTYGKESSLTDSSSSSFEDLIGFDGVTTSIPVTFDGVLSIPFSTKNSTNAYRPSFSINLVEVRSS